MKKSLRKLTPAVQWHEGMLLEPHHFQQNDRRYQELLFHQLYQSCPYYWGIQHLKIDPILLVGGVYRIEECDVVFPDGLIIFYTQDNEHPLELHLRPLLEKAEGKPFKIYLCVPEYRYDEANTTGELARFNSFLGDPTIDDNTGESELRIPRLSPRLSLMAGEVPSPRYVNLPVAEVEFKEDAFFLTPYIHPLLKVEKRSYLGEWCIQMMGKIREKAAYLVNRAQSYAGHAVRFDVEMTLRRLVAALPKCEAILYSEKQLPYTLYLALMDLVGHLAGLRIGMIPPVFEAYNHNDLRATFTPVLGFIQTILDSIEEMYTVLSFAQKERLFSLKLEPHYMHDFLILGARVPNEAKEADIVDWINNAVIVCDSSFESAQDKRILGVKREIIEVEERLNLVPPKGIILFKVANDSEFIHVQERLRLFNISDTPKKRPTGIVMYVPKKDE